MHTRILSFLSRLSLRWKLLGVVLPLIIIPVLGSITGYIANQQAYLGITQTSKDDLEHMTSFTIDLLNAHYQQFQVYKQDKEKSLRLELATLTSLAYNLVESEYAQQASGRQSREAAQAEANRALKKVNVGETGYIYAMTSKGTLKVHVAQEGENVFNERDESGRYFIREICANAVKNPGKILYSTYPWRNEVLGDRTPRNKLVAYRYFPQWDWIIASGAYLEESSEEAAFERRSFAELKERIKSKQVGKTGYIYCMNSEGTFSIHPTAEGKNFIQAKDSDGRPFLQEMCQNKRGWIRYPWKNPGEREPRMKIVRYEYFAPWDWIVAVGSYEDEFYHEANEIKGRIIESMVVLTLLIGTLAIGLLVIASKVLTDPINMMIEVIRRVKRGRLDEQMPVTSGDELGELAAAFNRMTAMIRHNKEMEATLAQQGKMASLGVLSSGVAHEINNPLGVILGYASYLESKISEDDPMYRFIHDIKRESKRCKKIVQDLLSYARTPKPNLEETDLNELLTQIVDFAANHTDLHNVEIRKEFQPDLPHIQADGDQLRQVAINLILNAGAAMAGGGRLVVRTATDDAGQVVLTFTDTGGGIPAEYLERIFEPFFTTKEKGTGLGLSITRQIVEMHMGQIEIESELGKGSTVRVKLPVEREVF
jgi:two-component system NtrC family sensor kinase